MATVFKDAEEFLRLVACVDAVIPRNRQQKFIEEVIDSFTKAAEPLTLFLPVEIAFLLLFQAVEGIQTAILWKTHITPFCDTKIIVRALRDALKCLKNLNGSILNYTFKETSNSLDLALNNETKYRSDDKPICLLICHVIQQEGQNGRIVAYNSNQEIVWISNIQSSSIDKVLKQTRRAKGKKTHADELLEEFPSDKNGYYIASETSVENENILLATPEIIEAFSGNKKLLKFQAAFGDCTFSWKVCIRLYNAEILGNYIASEIDSSHWEWKPLISSSVPSQSLLLSSRRRESKYNATKRNTFLASQKDLDKMTKTIDEKLTRSVQQIFVEFYKKLEHSVTHFPNEAALLLLFQITKYKKEEHWKTILANGTIGVLHALLKTGLKEVAGFAEQLDEPSMEYSRGLIPQAQEFLVLEDVIIYARGVFSDNASKEKYMLSSVHAKPFPAIRFLVICDLNKNIIWTSEGIPAGTSGREILKLYRTGSRQTYEQEITEKFADHVCFHLKGDVADEKVKMFEQGLSLTETLNKRFQLLYNFEWSEVLIEPMFRICCRLHNLVLRGDEYATKLLENEKVDESIWIWVPDTRPEIKKEEKPKPITATKEAKKKPKRRGKVQNKGKKTGPAPSKTISKPRSRKNKRNNKGENGSSTQSVVVAKSPIPGKGAIIKQRSKEGAVEFKVVDGEQVKDNQAKHESSDAQNMQIDQ